MDDTNSQEWVYHKREGRPDSKIRKWEQVAYNKLFFGQSLENVAHQLNEKFTDSPKHLAVFNPNDPVEIISTINSLLAETDWHVRLTVKEKETTKKALSY